MGEPGIGETVLTGTGGEGISASEAPQPATPAAKHKAPIARSALLLPNDCVRLGTRTPLAVACTLNLPLISTPNEIKVKDAQQV